MRRYIRVVPKKRGARRSVAEKAQVTITDLKAIRFNRFARQAMGLENGVKIAVYADPDLGQVAFQIAEDGDNIVRVSTRSAGFNLNLQDVFPEAPWKEQKLRGTPVFDEAEGLWVFDLTTATVLPKRRWPAGTVRQAA